MTTLQSTMICVDNSETMRNGDYAVSRFENAMDAANYLLHQKLRLNPENTVGIMKMSQCPEVLVTLTAEEGKLMTGLNKIVIQGTLDFLASLQICQLALKHRERKNQQQRMILLVGSVVRCDKEELNKFAVVLKKNNVAVDIVSFGECASNDELLKGFLDAVNSNGESHFVSVPSGDRPLKQCIRSILEVANSSSSAAPTSQGQFDDEEMDPEVLAAIRASLADVGQSSGAPTGPPASNGSHGGGDMDMEGLDFDDDPELALAIRLSMQEEADRRTAETAAAPATPANSSTNAPTSANVVNDSMDIEDEEFLQAMQMSMDSPSGGGNTAEAEQLSALLQSFPGVDVNDPRIQEAMQQFRNKKKDQQKK